MQSLINISSSITITVALPREDEQDTLSFLREVQLTGGQLGQWRSVRIERMYCAESHPSPDRCLPLAAAKASLRYSGILDTLHSTASRLAGKDERKKTGAKTEVNSGRWMDGFC